MYACIYVYKCIYMYIYTSLHKNECLDKSQNTCADIHIYIYIQVYVCKCACVCVSVSRSLSLSLCLSLCMYVLLVRLFGCLGGTCMGSPNRPQDSVIFYAMPSTEGPRRSSKPEDAGRKACPNPGSQVLEARQTP